MTATFFTPDQLSLDHHHVPFLHILPQFRGSHSKITSRSCVNTSLAATSRPNLHKVMAHKNGCLFSTMAPGKLRCSVLFMPLISVFLPQKVSIYPKRRASTVRALFKIRSPDESRGELLHCQQTVFLTPWKRNAAFCWPDLCRGSLNTHPVGGGGTLRTVLRTVSSEPDCLAPPAHAGDTSAAHTETGGNLISAPVCGVNLVYRLSGAVLTFAPWLLGTARKVGHHGNTSERYIGEMKHQIEEEQQIWCWRHILVIFWPRRLYFKPQSSQFPVLGAPVNISRAFQTWTGCPRRRLINPHPSPSPNTHISTQLISFLFHGHLLTKADHASLITAPGGADASLRVLLWRRSSERLHKRCRADQENGVSQPSAILYHPSRDPLSNSVCLFLFWGV